MSNNIYKTELTIEDKKVVLCFNTFNELKINEKFQDSKFEDVTNILLNSQTIKTTDNLINSLKEVINFEGELISSKELLSSYLIKYFDKDVLSGEMNEKEKLIFDKSSELVDYINSFEATSRENICSLIKKLSTYKFIFKDWKKKDLESQVRIYCEIFHDYRTKIDEFEKEHDENKEEYISHLKDLKNTIKNSIEKLVGTEHVDNVINKYPYVEKTYDKSVELLVKNYLRKAFWEEFRKDLVKEPPEYNQVNGILKDLSHYFNSLYQNKEKEEIKYINEYFDSEFLGEQIEKNCLNHNEIINLCKFVLEELQKLDAAEHDKNIREYNQKLNSINSQEEFLDIIIETLSYSMGRLEWLCETMIKVREVTNKYKN